MVRQKKLKEMTVYQCPDCKGSGEEIKDWDAYNNLGVSIGLSQECQERHARLVKKAFGECSTCQGKNFILKPKKK